MTSTIKISEKDKVFQIATVAGWVTDWNASDY